MAKKDSGIDWIGEIPEDWSIVKIGSLYYERNEHVSALDFEPLSVTKKGILPQLETAAKSDNPNDRKLVRINDFAINSRSDRRGSCGISQYDGSVSLINTVLVPHQIDLISGKFYEYVFHTDRFADEFYRWGHGIVDDLWTTRWQEMKKINLPFPSIEEQIKISSFLDSRTLQIKSLSENLTNQIDKLKEYKKALITKCVTKGLDPNVPLNDSGIEWIGDIPENWKTTKFKKVLLQPLQYGANESGIDFSNDLPRYIRITDILSDGTLRDNNKQSLPEEIASPYLLSENDVLIARSGSVGKTFLYHESYGKCAFAGYLIRAKINKSFSTRLVKFWFETSCFDSWKDRIFISTTIQNINAEKYSNFVIAIPQSLDEQERIADYLDKKCSEIDSLISSKQQQIDKLNEYQKSLIYEYVTGKKEVV